MLVLAIWQTETNIHSFSSGMVLWCISFIPCMVTDRPGPQTSANQLLTALFVRCSTRTSNEDPSCLALHSFSNPRRQPPPSPVGSRHPPAGCAAACLSISSILCRRQRRWPPSSRPSLAARPAARLRPPAPRPRTGTGRRRPRPSPPLRSTHRECAPDVPPPPPPPIKSLLCDGDVLIAVLCVCARARAQVGRGDAGQDGEEAALVAGAHAPGGHPGVGGVPEDGGQAHRRRAAHRRQWDALGHPHSRGTRRIRDVERRRGTCTIAGKGVFKYLPSEVL